ncbi:PfkB family carbohydrate kinase [Streptococcus ictaluri]|uniref:PfkB family carbohydrate kinase n=1 Tax=Streptococcus ictaluri TaxID=380397 RepID=UPI002E157D8D
MCRGKGINVSRILKRLDIETVATGFLGGFTGKFIEDSLTSEGIRSRFVSVNQDTRINVKVKSQQETEINGQGPEISKQELNELKAILNQLTNEDTVVFAGSAPSSLGNQVYKDLIPFVREKGAEVVCDFEGQNLLDSLAYQPLLVKPNNHEL